MDRKILAGFSMGVMVCLSCSLTNEPGPSRETAPEVLRKFTLRGPSSPQAPPELLQRLQALNESQGAAQDWFTTPATLEPTQREEARVYSYTKGELRVQLKVTATADGGYTWRVKLYGQSRGRSYSGWLLMDGWRSGDFNSGSWTLNDPMTLLPWSRFQWSIARINREITVILRDLQKDVTIQASNHANQSGTYSESQSGRCVYAAVWQPDGSGHWTKCDASGNFEGEGGWQ